MGGIAAVVECDEGSVQFVLELLDLLFQLDGALDLLHTWPHPLQQQVTVVTTDVSSRSGVLNRWGYSFMQRPVHLVIWMGKIWTGRIIGGRVKNEEAKKGLPKP